MKFYIVLACFIGLPVLVEAQAPKPSKIAPMQPGNPPGQNAVAVNPTPVKAVIPANAPKILCAHPDFDFGTVDEGPNIEHEFHIRNKGKSELRITHVGTSCGCTTSVMEEKGVEKTPNDSNPVIVPPGGRTIVKAIYHTSGRPGHAEKVITVTSNDPVNPQFQMHLNMTVVREIDVNPEKLYLTNIRHGQAKDTGVTITGKPGMKLSILSAQSTGNKVTVGPIQPFTNDKEDKSGGSFIVSVPATYPIGSFTDEIDVKTNDPKKPDVTIDVLGEVVGRLTFNQKQFFFPAHSQAPATITMTVEQPNGFAVRKVESLKHLVRVYEKTPSPGYGNIQYLIIAEPVGHIPDDSDGKDQVVIWTNDTEQASVTIDAQVNK